MHRRQGYLDGEDQKTLISLCFMAIRWRSPSKMAGGQEHPLSGQPII